MATFRLYDSHDVQLVHSFAEAVETIAKWYAFLAEDGTLHVPDFELNGATNTEELQTAIGEWHEAIAEANGFGSAEEMGGLSLEIEELNGVRLRLLPLDDSSSNEPIEAHGATTLQAAIGLLQGVANCELADSPIPNDIVTQMLRNLADLIDQDEPIATVREFDFAAPEEAYLLSIERAS